jgi:hypothetical protein
VKSIGIGGLIENLTARTFKQYENWFAANLGFAESPEQPKKTSGESERESISVSEEPNINIEPI